ncbi:hypothetical protein [Methylobacterium iners]|jgi:hypothetical protein|uniref:Uncharacterized protein n=1 Tax=Methylobacterium iners TaxID=418707 RepID=A0ABQ4RY67_9HYPH|nr:hypothetical protein [Methylobacterium iners]GJD94527.1 hypothetical protein OCOJLMKI_1730 [Methylobacterium iners]
MTNVLRFPGGRCVSAGTISREEFERLVELALDVVERIIALLDEADGYPDAEDGGETEPSLASPIGGPCQLIWATGGDRDMDRP